MVIEALRLSGCATACAVLDADRSLWGKELLGVRILGDDDLLPDLKRKGVVHFVVGVGSVGNNMPRRRLFERALSEGLEPIIVRHPSAVCSESALIGPGSVLLPLAVVNAGARLGVNVIVNTGAILEHDCVVGDHAHIATGARLAGGVRVGASAHVGAGAAILQSLSIGERAVVGAGAVVVRDVRADATVVGNPARMLEARTAVLA